MTLHTHYMQKALALARQALDQQEFPVGCILVYEDRVIAQGERTGTRQQVPSELDHAEIVALRQLESINEPIDRKKITLYATLEPCLMCFGALLIAGIGALVYAYEDAMGGGTACEHAQMPELYHNNRPNIIPGVCRKESLSLFKAFFANPRINYWRGSYLARYTLDQP